MSCDPRTGTNLSVYDLAVNLSGGDVVVLGERHAQIPLIIAKIQINFASIVQHKDFPVFQRRHGSRIDIHVWVDFDCSDA